MPHAQNIPMCPSCGALYEGATSLLSCPRCSTALTTKSIFVRWKKERILFVITLALFVLAGYGTIAGPEGVLMAVMPWDEGGTIGHWVVFVAAVMLIPYMAGPALLGLPKWKEYIPADLVSSPQDLFRFKWRSYFMESLVTIGLLLLVIVSLGVIALVRFIFAKYTFK